MRLYCGVIASSVLATSVSAMTLSFASDSHSGGPVLAGGPLTGVQSRITDGGAASAGGSVTVTLLADPDGDGPLTGTSGQYRFVYDGVIRSYTRVQVGTRWLHTYVADGQFSFRPVATPDQVVMSVLFGNGIFSSWSDSSSSWGESASFQANTPTDTLQLTGVPPLVPAGESMTSMTFALSGVHTAEGGRVAVDDLGNVGGAWLADASWTARTVPGPGSTALAVIAVGVLAARRRR